MFSELIYSYTRRQAIDDGVLIDVTATAKELGFSVSVAVTSTLWHEHIKPSEALVEEGQSVEGRLWDLLNLLRVHAPNSNDCLIIYTCLFQMESAHPPVPQKVKAHIGPGDNGEPVITIMLPEED